MAHSPLLKDIKSFLLNVKDEETKLLIRKTEQHELSSHHSSSISTQNNVPNVIIVGAGLAGLTCAYHLLKHGIVTTVYEASNRIGGRCWTKRSGFSENQIIERGGELIDSNHKEIIGLITELDLTLDDLLKSEKKNTKPVFFINNTNFSVDDANKIFFEIHKKVKKDIELAGFPTLYSYYTKHGKLLDHMSITDWINANVPGGIESKFGQLLSVAYTIENGAECTEQSALNLIQLLGSSDGKQFKIFGESDERFRVRGGNDQIVTKLSEKLKNQITTNHSLVAIKQNDDHTITLTFNNDSCLKDVYADKVVLALPFSILNSSVDYFKAGFKPLKVAAIKELGMGSNAKLHFQFKKRFWDGFNCNGTTFTNQRNFQSTFESSRAQPGECGVLIHFSGGKNVEYIKQNGFGNHTKAFLADLENMFPGCSDYFNGNRTLDLWSTYKWTKGSYSYRKVGQFTKFAGVEKEREGQCHFAGEHTSIHFSSYMNGAVESGLRAANEIIEDLI